MVKDVEESPPPPTHEELFKKLLIPEIFSNILGYLKDKDRLNLRLCSHATEQAVAQSDCHLDRQTGMIYIWGDVSGVTVHLGLKRFRDTLALHKPNEKMEQIAIIKERLFKRIFTREVDINGIDFNKVPVSFVERLLRGCVYDWITIYIHRVHYTPEIFDLLRKIDSKKIDLTFEGFVPESDALLSLKFMRKLRFKENPSKSHPRNWDTVSDELFLDLVKKRHACLEIPFAVASAETIVRAKEIFETSDNNQTIIFNAEPGTVDRFLIILGYCMTRDSIKKIEKPEIGTADRKQTANVKLKLHPKDLRFWPFRDFELRFDGILLDASRAWSSSKSQYRIELKRIAE